MESIDVVKKAVAVIKQWHQADNVWDIYYNHSPEMKPIRDYLKKYVPHPMSEACNECDTIPDESGRCLCW